VTTVPAERTALLVIRAWFEANGEPRLRARITQTTDLTRRNEISTVVATRSEITSVVGQWLDSVVGDGVVTEP
jgi:hypothetical protein